MNIRLKEVLSQTHGASGMAIIEAILNGERNREVLANLCHASILKTKKPQILAALEGKYTDAYLFSLKQAFDAYMFYQQMISECDIKITEVLKRINKDKIADIVDKTKSENKRKPIRHNKPKVENLGQHLLHIFEGQDATLISGITDYTWLELTSEIGTDLSRWSTEKHFTSWLGLSPGQNNSGKKRKNARKKGKPKAGQTFRLIAQSLINSKKVAIGEFGRRLRGRKGSAVAIKAMARKLAIIYWRIMNKGIEYVENGVKHYQEQIMRNKLKAFHRLANELKMDISILQ